MGLAAALNVEWRVGEPNMVDGLSRGTLRRVGKSELCELADRLWEDWRPVQREALPTAPDEVEDDDLVERLIDHGVPTDRAELITSTIWQIRKLASWYQRRGSNIGEHEIRTFLIVPLLLALGWAEQRIKIEFEQLDLALFDAAYDGGAEPELVIESKRLYDGLGGDALKQAQDYAGRYATCCRLIVTDGIRYKLLTRANGDWNATAYANLLKLRNRHPVEEHVACADELFLHLLP